MKRAYFACLFQCLATAFLLPQSNPVPLINQSVGVVSPISASKADPKAQARILDSYGKLPLSFEANHGQAHARVKFLSRTGGYSLFLTGDEAVFTLIGGKATTHKAKIAGTARTLQSGMAAPKSGGVFRMKLRDANPAAKVSGVDELAGTSNYFIGNDPKKWRTGVPTYSKVKYEGIYSGIDLVYYGNQRQLEYDFIVAPGADPRRIAFDVRGAKRIRRDAHGDLVLGMETGEDEIRWLKPVVYQQKDGTRREVPARYAIKDRNRVGFELAKYDPSRPLYIDPLIYSTYLGGSGGDQGNSIAVDGAGNSYVTGLTDSSNFPTMNPLQPAYGGNGDAVITKLNPTGSALVYSTYLGGNGFDGGYGIAVDSAGNAYVTGSTGSANFPITSGAFQTNLAGYSNAFVAEISPTGTALVYSTFLGGSGGDKGYSIAVDSAGNAYVTGWTESTDFPTVSPLQPARGGGADAFVTKINPTGSALVYSTYLGGSLGDAGYGIAVDNSGNAYVTGSTASTNFPTTPGAFQTTGGDGYNYDAFVTKINPTGSALVYSTYLGGSSGNGFGSGSEGIAVDSAGNAYVTGSTGSANFPTTPGAFQTSYNGSGQYGADAFVTKINLTGSALVYSTYLGGSGLGSNLYLENNGISIATDSAGNAYVTGQTHSKSFPVTPGAFQRVCNRGDHCDKYGDAFVTRLNSAGSALVDSTYLGGSSSDGGFGIAVDGVGNAYVTGGTASTDFAVTPGSFQMSCGNPSSCGNAFVTKIDLLAATTITLTSSRNPSTYGQAVTFTAVITSGLGAPPDGETVSFMKGTKILGTGMLSGGSASFTISTFPVGHSAITAVYGGDSNFASCISKAVKQVVNKATTATALASSQNPSNVGQSVTFTASVTPQFGGKVTGSVTFYDGTTMLKTVALSGGVAKFTTSTLVSGAHNITATYNGSANFTGSSASLTQTVN
jgi:hypothetical protein